jgi:hypothetical protein
MKNLKKQPKKNQLLEINGKVLKDIPLESTENNHVKFNSGKEISNFFENEEINHVLSLESTFEKILKDWRLLENIHDSVSQQIVDDFTEGQITCIFDILNDESLSFHDSYGIEIQAKILQYIEDIGKNIYNLGNVEDFVSKIMTMNPVIFVILISKIKKHYDEIYDSEYQKEIISALYEFMQKKSAKVFS